MRRFTGNDLKKLYIYDNEQMINGLFPSLGDGCPSIIKFGRIKSKEIEELVQNWLKKIKELGLIVHISFVCAI